jgi:hypothetical protein
MESNSSAFVIFMLVAWCFFGYWGGTIARRKGYSFGLGFAVGFFGGIIGIVVLYLIKPSRQSVGKTQYPPYPPQQHYQQPPPQYGPPQGPPPPNKVCQQCFNLVPADSQFCSYCGASVMDAHE